MMSKEIKTLLSENSTVGSEDPTIFTYGNKTTGAGYNKNSDGLHTITFDLSEDWVGIIKIQATLELYPGDKDWFDTDINSDELYQWGDFTSTDWAGLNSVNISGKFVWLRAAFNNQAGQINEIRYNY